MDWRVSLVGFTAGWLVGLTGIGAGSLTMPLLVLWIGVPPLQAIGSDLVYSSVTKMVGGWQHVRLGSVDLRRVSWLALGSVPASIAASWWVAGLGSDAGGGTIRRLLGAALVLAALVLCWQVVRRRREPPAERSLRRWVMTGVGTLLGGVVGATSVGSGSFGTALLSFTTRLDSRRLVGTVVVHAMVLTFAGALTHLAVGTVQMGLVAALLLGSIPGVVLGSRLTVRTPEPVLRAVLAGLLLVLGIRMQAPSAAAARPAERTEAPPPPPLARGADAGPAGAVNRPVPPLFPS